MPRRAPTRFRVLLPLYLAGFGVCAQRAGAQTVLQVEGGGTTLTGGYGSQVHFWSGDFEGWLGAGYARGWRLAGFLKHPVGRDTLRAGLDVQSLVLPTDLFSGGSFLLTQGLAWRRVRPHFDATLFGGAVGTGIGAPFVNTARAEKPLGLAIVDVRPTSSLLLQTHLVGARRQSALETIAWSSDAAVHTIAATGGVGANAPFGSITWHTSSEHVELRAGYTDFAAGFRRADAPMPDLAEPWHESVLLTLRVPRRASLTLGHQNFRQLDTASLAGGPDARVDQALATIVVAGTTFGGGGFQTTTAQGRTLSTVSSVAQPLPFGATASALYFQTFPRGQPAIRTLQGELREPVTSSLTLSELFAKTGRSVSAGLGGRYQRGFTTIALDYQNYYVPLRRPDPFMRALTLTIRLQLANTSASVGTSIDPFGHVSYAASGGTFLYLGELTGGVQPITVRFERYVIRGVVVDDAGRPVDGAAIDIGGDHAHTNSRGEFFVRVKSRAQTSLRVAFEDFLAVGSYAVLSAPAAVVSDDEDHALPVRIVLRSVHPPAPAVGAAVHPVAPAAPAHAGGASVAGGLGAPGTAGPPRSAVVIPLGKERATTRGRPVAAPPSARQSRSAARPATTRDTTRDTAPRDTTAEHGAPQSDVRIQLRKDARPHRRAPNGG